MTDTTDPAHHLPPICYIRHVTTGDVVMIRRGEPGYVPVETPCSPECLNARLPQPPTEDDVAAMRHGSLIGWDGPGADPNFWRRRRGQPS